MGNFSENKMNLLIKTTLFLSKKRQFFFLLATTFLSPLSSVANEAFLSADEQRFISAEKAIAKGNLVEFQRLKMALEDKTLEPYLEFKEVSRNLSDSDSVTSFIEQYPDSYLANRLRHRWINWLGSNQRWKQFLKLYREDGAFSNSEALRCYATRAELSINGETKTFLDQSRKLWLKGDSVNDACDPLFEKLYSKGKISTQLRWQRVHLAMKKNKVSLARYLAKKLPSKDQSDFDRWLTMHKKSEKNLKKAKKWRDTKRNRQIITHGIKRYSKVDTVKAWRHWHDNFKPRFEFSDEQISDIETRLVLRAAWRHLPEAHQWFQLIPDELLNEEAREWRVRTAMRALDWPAVAEFIELLPEKARTTKEWRYWKARAYEDTEYDDISQGLYEELANNTGFYNFLAADKLGTDYIFTHEPVVDEAAAKSVEEMAALPAFRRVKALYELGRKGRAYAEWIFETGKMSDSQKRIAARLAHDWRWHFTAIVTTAKAGHFSDLNLRFPLLFNNFVQQESKKRNVRPSLVYGVMRRESAFKENAVSPAGALGLMQVMPSTARMISRKSDIKRRNKQQLKKAQFNIEMGTYYLRDVLNRYNDHEILATASYNAGPHRVQKWLPESDVLPADIWVDSITFDETRNYVKAVHFYSTIFDWKSDGRVDHNLQDRMKPVEPITSEKFVRLQ